MSIEEDGPILFSKILQENDDKGLQIRLVVNDFRDITYIQLRKYFLSYEGEWLPSREGVSFPLTIENSYFLLDGLLEILSKSEGEAIITKYYNQIKEISCTEQTGKKETPSS